MKKIFLMLMAVGMLASCATKDAKQEGLSQVNREDFQAEIDGKPVDLYTLKNANGLEMTVTNFGGRVVELFTPDREGNFADIVLGHETLDKYVNYDGERFLGATIGRYGNRIKDGKFTLDGVEYQVPTNDGPNSLHGGTKGFDMVVWDAEQVDDEKLVLKYTSVDGEMGYPGTLEVTMTYELTDDNEFVVTHDAKVLDKATVLNLTHHSFFNLHGAGEGTINDHELQILASKYTPVDATLIPTGELADVEGTPMDFREATEIGARIKDDYTQEEFEQFRNCRGYDHNWVLDKGQTAEPELAAVVFEPQSGRGIEVYTTEPGIQFYGGNFFDGTKAGKQGKAYNHRASLALETQHYPDSPNQPSFPTTVLKPGEDYHHVCIYKFFAK